ncbi:hypothetical protein B9Z55_017488 [Caenorhabditis nigoni]|nr:hypothetical protein B9Z55_017488 [Caenorhabditis nigoni]
MFSTTVGSELCVDNFMACPDYKAQCNEDYYKRICPKTCGNCETTVLPSTTKTTKKPTPTTSKPPCKDASPNCQAWAKDGFCHNKFYPLEKRKEYCAKTCKLC